MIGEINGQAVNAEIPLNGLSPRVKIVLSGFVDSLFSDRGLELRVDLPVVGFTDSIFYPLYLWDSRREPQVIPFCSPVESGIFESCAPADRHLSDDEALEFDSQDYYGAYTSIQNTNTRGQC